MAVTLAFVDSIASAPVTRLDLNDGTVWSLLGDPDFSPPPLKRSVVSTLLRDGAEIPASAYDNRVIRLPLLLVAASQDALATQLQTLNRELDRAKNILKWQTNGATNPVFFRTFRSPDYALDVSAEKTADKNRAWITLNLQAEPFAYGLKVTDSAVTVNNDPAHATNPMRFDVIGVTGDVPTPAYIKVRGADSAEMCALAVRRHGTPSDNTWFKQAESFTQGTDTTTQANAAAYSGAGNNFSRTTFATTAMTGRLSAGGTIVGGGIPSGDPTAAQSKAWRGTYRMFVRVKKNTAGDVVKIRMIVGGVKGNTVTLPADANHHVMDLGLFNVPTMSSPALDGYGGLDLGTEGTECILQAERTSGSGTLDWDYAFWLPADEELSIIKWPSAFNPNLESYLDGPQDTVYFTEDGNQIVLSGTDLFPLQFARTGSLPMLAPGQTNRLFFLANIDTGSNTIADTSTLTVSYWPRWIWIRPA